MTKNTQSGIENTFIKPMRESQTKLTPHDVNSIIMGEGFPVNNWLIRMGNIYNEVADINDPNGVQTLSNEDFELLVVSQTIARSDLGFPIDKSGLADTASAQLLRKAIIIVDQTIKQDLEGLKVGVTQIKELVLSMKLSDGSDFNTIARLLWIIELVRRRERVYNANKN